MTMFAEFSKFVLSISVCWSVISSGWLGIDENLVNFLRILVWGVNFLGFIWNFLESF